MQPDPFVYAGLARSLGIPEAEWWLVFALQWCVWSAWARVATRFSFTRLRTRHECGAFTTDSILVTR